MKRLLLSLLMCLMAACLAAAEFDPSRLEIEQKLDAKLPLQLVLREESGHAVQLGDYFGSVPVVLVLGYFQCQNLCSTVLDGVLEVLSQAKQPASDYRLLAVSIDPREDPSNARRKRDAYRFILAQGVEAHFLTGQSDATQRLASSVGFPFAWDAEQEQYMHPAGFMVVGPKGRVSRYFLGVRFEQRDLRLALVEASAGRVGSLRDRLLLLCSHYDAQSGRYNFAAMTAVRGMCLLITLCLAVWLWRQRTGGKA